MHFCTVFKWKEGAGGLDLTGHTAAKELGEIKCEWRNLCYVLLPLQLGSEPQTSLLL